MQWSWHPVQLSFFVAASAAFIALLAATAAAYWMTSARVRGRTIIETVFFLPLVLPPTVIGFMLIMVFGNQSSLGRLIEWATGRSVLFTAAAAVIAAAVVAFPLMYQSIKTGFLSVDRHVIAAAKVDGASSLQALWAIILPLSGRAFANGIVLGFTRAFGEFGATLMFAGNIPGRTQTVPTAIYFAIETGNSQFAWYYTLISIGFSFVLLLLINRAKPV